MIFLVVHVVVVVVIQLLMFQPEQNNPYLFRFGLGLWLLGKKTLLRSWLYILTAYVFMFQVVCNECMSIRSLFIFLIIFPLRHNSMLQMPRISDDVMNQTRASFCFFLWVSIVFSMLFSFLDAIYYLACVVKHKSLKTWYYHICMLRYNKHVNFKWS